MDGAGAPRSLHASKSLYPTPQTLTTNRSSGSRQSFTRRRDAWESSVRVRWWAWYPQTSRRSSVFLNTRCGSTASMQSSSNSLPASGTRSPRTVAVRVRRAATISPPPPRPLVRRGQRAPEHGSDPGEQLVVDERALDDVVGATLERTDAIDGVGLLGHEHDHGYVSIP